MRRISGRGYTIEYGGGRLADVVIDGSAIECVQVRDYDFATGELGPEPSAAEIRRAVADFITEAGGLSLYIENTF